MMDAPTEHSPCPPETNSATTILKWLRLNLGVTLMIFSIISGVCGALISATLRVAAADYQIGDLVRVNNEQQKQIDQLHADMVDVDRRLNAAGNHSNEIRRTRDSEIAVLQQRIAVLEAQLRFVADRTPTLPVGARR